MRPKTSQKIRLISNVLAGAGCAAGQRAVFDKWNMDLVSQHFVNFSRQQYEIMTILNPKYILLLLLPIIFLYTAGCGSNGKTVKVKFSVETRQPIRNQNIYITGNIDQLGNWNPAAVQMKRVSDSLWTKTLLLPAHTNVEFKITKGSWKTEAADSSGWLFSNFTFNTNSDSIITIRVPQWKDNLYSRSITGAMFNNPDPRIYLVNNWKYHSGDNPAWAKENYNDSTWETVKSDLYPPDFPEKKWKNIGWFRTHLKIDSTVWNKSFAFTINHYGASEVYLNGRLYLKTGTIGSSEKNYVPYYRNSWKSFRFDKQKDQVIAVRYADYSFDYQVSINLQPGFSIYLAPVNFVLQTVSRQTRSSTVEEMVFTLIPFILALFHLIMFGFYRKQRQNLYYALTLLGFAGLTFFKYEQLVINSPDVIFFFIIMTVVSSIIAIFFGMLTAFSISYKKLPRYWLYFLISGLVIISLAVFHPLQQFVGILIYVYFGAAVISVLLMSFRKNETNLKGTPIVFTGFVLLVIFIVYQLLIDYSYITPTFNISNVFVYGMLALAVSMSIFLAYNFAYINKDLELQLDNVKKYSQKAIEQERIANKAELERRVIEAENDRKTKELEDARKLQLSLLPQKIPRSSKYDIACFIQTATEVGGDYYDFFESGNGQLTIAIGDATGHGLKAGNMVMTSKALLNLLSKEKELKSIMNLLNENIKKMNLHMLTMGLALLRINEGRIEYSSAGMPPLMIYKAESGTIEKIVLKAMPLGAFSNFPYECSGTNVKKGDIILMMSDGLPELFNRDKEMYGSDNIEASLIANTELSADEILRNIYEESRIWSSGIPQADDITLITIKIKE